MDSIGFGFEHLDATGRYRAREGRFEIDDSGTILGTSAGDIAFRGPSELASNWPGSPRPPGAWPRTCPASRSVSPRRPASCLVGNAAAELRAGMGIVDFYVRMARSEHFRTRVP